MSLDAPTLDEFVRHAERFGTEHVYETALDFLHDPRELGFLSLALQRIDRRWQLSREHRAALALALHEIGVPTRQICEMAQISRRTLHRLGEQREEVAEVAKPAANSAQPCAADVPKPGTPNLDVDGGGNGTPACTEAFEAPRS